MLEKYFLKQICFKLFTKGRLPILSTKAHQENKINFEIDKSDTICRHMKVSTIKSWRISNGINITCLLLAGGGKWKLMHLPYSGALKYNEHRRE